MPKRDHIPALSGRRLRQAIRAIEKLPLNKRAKRSLQAQLLEAADPNRHEPEHAAGRQHGANIRATETSIAALNRAYVRRVSQVIDAGPDNDDAWMDAIEEGLRGE